MKLWHKFITYIFIVILILSGTMFLFIVQSRVYTNAYQKILYNVYLLNETYSLLEETEEELESYLTTNKLTNNESFNRKFDELYRSINSMPIKFSTKEEQFAYSDIRGTLITLNLQIEDCLKAFRGRNPQETKRRFEEVKQTGNQMKATIDYLVLKYMSTSHELYDFIEKDRQVSQKFSIYIIGLMVAFSFISTVTFVKKLTDSLMRLSDCVNSFANEPENIHIATIESEDEVGSLAKAFNIMAEDIRTYIGQVNEKMQIENELKNTELKMLQSQINPHFLFNTLNCIAQNAMLEEADNTYGLILTVSSMLRYNLRQLDKPVMLRKELENLEKYIYIQNARYGDKIEFRIGEIEEEVLDLMIPCLTIQPIVENSVIHGLEGIERRGIISIEAKVEGEAVGIVIADNGTGMEEELLQKIRNLTETQEEIKGHSTGIGIKNVIYRMRLFYGEDVFHIESRPGEGTRITLNIPFRSQQQEKREGREC